MSFLKHFANNFSVSQLVSYWKIILKPVNFECNIMGAPYPAQPPLFNIYVRSEY